MFLYAKLVMKNLVDQTRLVKMREELKPGTFPKGIDQAYFDLSSRRYEPVANSMAGTGGLSTGSFWILI